VLIGYSFFFLKKNKREKNEENPARTLRRVGIDHFICFPLFFFLFIIITIIVERIRIEQNTKLLGIKTATKKKDSFFFIFVNGTKQTHILFTFGYCSNNTLG
jgi:hypothetical protein